ncbi:hypothetical protein LTR72_004980 [Exophiala xenobiotica]|nr:hypothetical protein LTR72_004980 [Exophiala xenobiotica]KAK5286664.1 hypothetical protein LTR14_009731 [Exophiala xenobiotica]KAK5499889.1 hypothetical protein LTR55_000712 [Exophiala xenobiotica]
MERTNISYYTVPAAWALCLAPHVYVITLYDKASTADKFDRVNPRTLLSALNANRTIDSSVKQRIARAEGAQLNSFENLGFYAGSVVAANAAGVDVRYLNALSMIYILNRAFYTVLYIKGASGFTRGGPFYAALIRKCCEKRKAMRMRRANLSYLSLTELWHSSSRYKAFCRGFVSYLSLIPPSQNNKSMAVSRSDKESGTKVLRHISSVLQSFAVYLPAFLYVLHCVTVGNIAMSPELEAFWLVAAPEPNFEKIATINVCNHEVPLPAYWRIVQLFMEGKTEREVVQLVIPHTGSKTLKVVTDVVNSIFENQRRIQAPSKTSNRPSVLFKKPKNVSAYRASRIEARRDLETAQVRLRDAKQQEEQLLNHALTLSRQKEQLQKQKMNSDDRRKTLATIENQMKQVLERHKNVEADIEYATTLTILHRASLA